MAPKRKRLDVELVFTFNQDSSPSGNLLAYETTAQSNNVHVSGLFTFFSRVGRFPWGLNKSQSQMGQEKSRCYWACGRPQDEKVVGVPEKSLPSREKSTPNLKNRCKSLYWTLKQTKYFFLVRGFVTASATISWWIFKRFSWTRSLISQIDPVFLLENKLNLCSFSCRSSLNNPLN